MQRAIMAGVTLAAALGYAAQVKGAEQSPSSSDSPTLSASMSQHAAHPARLDQKKLGLAPGMVVLDRRGAKVGIITRVDQIRDGRPAVLLMVNGTPITVRVSKFTVTPEGDEAIVSLTKSEIRTSAILNTY
jgi:hypothetical protein